MRFPRARKRTLAMLLIGIGGLIAGDFYSRQPSFPTILGATRLTVYEGLPNPFGEAEKLDGELKTKETMRLVGFPFYQNPLILTVADLATLKGLIGDADTYAPYMPAGCGGFHPDYAIEWRSHGLVYRCLICFGCSEVRVYGPLGHRAYDLSGKDLRNLLSPYRKNRPPHDPFP